MLLQNVQTGKDENVADAQSALSAGSHVGIPGNAYSYVHPDTKEVFETDGAGLRDRILAGATLETAAMRQEREQREIASDYPGTAALAGAGRGLSFGATDAVLGAMGLGDAARQVKEASPNASILGEVGGILIPTLLSGGSGLVGQASKGATSGLRLVGNAAEHVGDAALERMGVQALKETAAGEIVRTLPARLAGSVIEGAAFGAGKSVSEASLGEPHNVAENVLLSGLLGGAGSMILEGTLAAGKAALEKGVPALSKLVTDTPLAEIKQMMEMSEAGAARRAAQFKGPKLAIDHSDVKTAVVDGMRDLNETVKGAADKFRDVKFAKAEEILPQTRSPRMDSEVSDLIMKGSDALQKMDAQPSVYSVSKARKLDEALNDLGKSAKDSESPAELFKSLDEFKNTLRSIKASGAPGPEKEAAILVGDVWKDAHKLLENPEVWGEAATAQRQLNEAYSSVVNRDYGTVRPFAKYFGRMRQDGTVEIDPGKVLRWAKRAGEPEAMAADEAFQNHMSAVRNLRDVMEKNGAPEDLVQRGAMAEAEGRTRDAVSELKDRMKAGDPQDEFNKINETKFLGVGILSRAAAAAGRTAAMVPRLLAEVEHGLNATNRDWMQGMSKVFDFLQSGKPGAMALRVTDLAKSKEELEKVAKASTDQAAVTRAVQNSPGPLRYAAPQLSAAIQQRFANIAGFIASKAPQQPGTDEFGRQKPWEPSDSELARFRRYFDAMNRPQVLIEDLRAGRLTPETVEAVKAVYPNYYQRTVEATLQYVNQKQPEMSQAARQQLNVLMGKGMDSRQRTADLQKSYQSSADNPSKPGPKPRMSGQGAQRVQTQAQRIEGGSR